MGFGIALNALRFTLVRQDGTWKIDREDNIAVEIPDGTETIEAETYEFAFNIDTDALAAATEPVAIAIDNIGTQPHELAIIRVPADADVLALFQRPGGGEMELVGQEGPLEPGESLNLVFTQALEPGRYVILSLLSPRHLGGPERHAARLQGDAGRVHEVVALVGAARRPVTHPSTNRARTQR